MLTISMTTQGRDALAGLDAGIDLDTPQMQMQMRKVGLLVQGDAVENSPISMTKSQYLKTLKPQNRKKSKAKSENFQPGSLEKSIKHQLVSSSEVDVFTATNAGVGEYAVRIHDEKGTSWRNRGPGTVAKGGKADHKFIERAISDNEDSIGELIVIGAIKSIEGN